PLLRDPDAGIFAPSVLQGADAGGPVRRGRLAVRRDGAVLDPPVLPHAAAVRHLASADASDRRQHPRAAHPRDSDGLSRPRSSPDVRRSRWRTDAVFRLLLEDTPGGDNTGLRLLWRNRDAPAGDRGDLGGCIR